MIITLFKWNYIYFSLFCLHGVGLLLLAAHTVVCPLAQSSCFPVWKEGKQAAVVCMAIWVENLFLLSLLLLLLLLLTMVAVVVGSKSAR